MQEQITVTFHPDPNSNYTYTIPDVVKMSDKDLSKDLKEQASRYLWFRTLSNRLMAKRDNISNHLRSLLASTEINIRRLAESSGTKTTEAAVKAQVELDPEVNKIKTFLGEAEAEFAMCQSIQYAFEQRKDMIVSLGANMRAELNAFNPDNLSK